MRKFLAGIPLQHRAKGFGRIFNLLYKIKSKPIIVETGCIRKMEGWTSDGSSTILFEKAAIDLKGTFISVDLNPSHCALAKDLCPSADVRCGDSIQLLYSLRKEIPRIDLLYLDSFDIDWDNPHPSALHHFQEFCAAQPLLKPGSLVFIDDNAFGRGKGMYVADFLKKITAKQLLDDYQIGFRIP